MKFKNLLIGLFSLLVILLISCEKNNSFEENDLTKSNSSNNDGMTILGDQLENPFTVENMQSAYSILKSESTETPSIQIETTHLYIRFLPKNFDELSILKNDSSLVLYEIPLDYEITEPGTFYHDPTLPDSMITYQYCAIPANKILPNVSYELLAKLYLPPVEIDDTLKSANSDAIFLAQLEEKALEISGNLKNEVNLKRSKYRPAGRITVWDDVTSSLVPVEGVKIKARRWFTTYTGITNSRGYYVCDGTFKRDANYSLDWERYNFTIRSGTVGQAEYDGPKQDGDWNLDIRGGASQYYATIFRAAHHYYYGDIKGLKRPPENSFWKPQMKIAAMYESNADINGVHNAGKRFLSIGNWIKIYNPSNKCNDIYATVIHELAHASHWDMDHSDFNSTDDIVKESWARGVQWVLTKMVYPNYKGGITVRPDYTQVVMDMIDYQSDDNTNYGANNPTDKVSRYTIKEIEDALVGSKSFIAWKDNIKNKYTNETELNLDVLFTYWSN